MMSETIDLQKFEEEKFEMQPFQNGEQELIISKSEQLISDFTSFIIQNIIQSTFIRRRSIMFINKHQ